MKNLAQVTQFILSGKMIVFLIAFMVFLSSQGYAQLAGYSFRKQITIDNTKVSGSTDHIDFPFLVNVTDPDLRTTGNGGDVTNANGYDIAFTSSDGVTLMDHEIEFYAAITGEYVAWVRIPILDYDDDTEIYMYYGNNAADNRFSCRVSNSTCTCAGLQTS